MNPTYFATSRQRLAAACVLVVAPFAAKAWSSPLGFQVIIEPDNYADSQVLNTISPYVTLSTGVPPSNQPTFDVVAFTNPSDASTGNKVFAHAGGIPFWNTSRTFRMDFQVPVTSVSLDYIASGFMSGAYAGRLAAYSSANTLLDSYTTASLADSQFETMTVAAPQIAYAIAYPPADPFGDLDHLSFTAVPEPGILLLAGIATVFAATLLRGRRTQPFVFRGQQFRLN